MVKRAFPPTAPADPVEQLIDQQFDQLSPELQRAARWVRQHGTALALHSMRSSARQAGVSPATMTRLAQRLGFDGFEALRAPFVRRLAGGLPVVAASRMPAQGEQALLSTLTELNQAQQAHVADVLRSNPLPVLVGAADAVLEARVVDFLGLRVSLGIAFQMHYAYSLLAPNGVQLTHLGGTLDDQLLQVGKGHLLVAISQSPYARATVDAVQTARRQGAQVLALTDSPLSPIARDASHCLLFGGTANTFFHSTSGALALIETLLATVAQRGGAAVRDHFVMRQQRLHAGRAYWESPGRLGGAAARPQASADPHSDPR